MTTGHELCGQQQTHCEHIRYEPGNCCQRARQKFIDDSTRFFERPINDEELVMLDALMQELIRTASNYPPLLVVLGTLQVAVGAASYVEMAENVFQKNVKAVYRRISKYACKLREKDSNLQ